MPSCPQRIHLSQLLPPRSSVATCRYLADVDAGSWALECCDTPRALRAETNRSGRFPWRPMAGPCRRHPGRRSVSGTGNPGRHRRSGMLRWHFRLARPLAWAPSLSRCLHDDEVLFGSGEGGALFSVERAANQQKAIAQALKLRVTTRTASSRSASTNGKMSEYARGRRACRAQPDGRTSNPFFVTSWTGPQHHLGAAGLLASFHCAPDSSACYALDMFLQNLQAKHRVCRGCRCDRGVDYLGFGMATAYIATRRAETRIPRRPRSGPEEIAPRLSGCTAMAADLTEFLGYRPSQVDAVADSLGAIAVRRRPVPVTRLQASGSTSVLQANRFARGIMRWSS